MARRQDGERVGAGTEPHGRASEGERGLSAVIGGTLDLLGFRIDLGKLLDSPEQVQGRLQELRERLKAVGGPEVVSDDAWKRGGASVSGFIRTRGVLGDREFHIGTAGPPPAERPARGPAGPQADPVEPPLDVFDEPKEVLIVADVPGAALKDLEIGIEGRTFTLATRPGTRHRYHKVLELDEEVDAAAMRATCRNGVLEVRVPKRRGPG